MGVDIETIPLKSPYNPTIDSCPQTPTTDSCPQTPTIDTQPPPTYDEEELRDIADRIQCCCGIVFAVLVAYFFFFIVIPFSFPDPYTRTIYHPEFRVHSFKVSSLNIASDKEIHGNFSLTLAANNPKGGINIRYNSPKFFIFYKKDDYRYHSPKFSMFYKKKDDMLLAQAKIASFEQKAGELSLMEVNLPALPVNNDSSETHSLNYDVSWTREAKFTVKLQDELTITPGSSADKKNISMTVSCNVWVEFEPNGKSGQGQDTEDYKCSVI